MARVVVVADDDADILRLIRMVLEDAGYEVEPAVGAKTLDEVREHDPDVVLLDYQMPEMDGVQVARKIRNDLHHERARIVAMTAGGRAGWVCRAMQADGCLSKPFDIDTLVTIVEQPEHQGHD